MKLNENNAKFAIVKSAFWGGGAISFHNNLQRAILKKKTIKTNGYKLVDIIPITDEALQEMKNYNAVCGEPYFDTDNIRLYKQLPTYTGNQSAFTICR